MRGKVSVVIEQIEDYGRPFIIVKSFNEKGMLVRANYYEQNNTSSDLKLDTTNLFLARFEIYDYKSNIKLLKTRATNFKNEYMEYTKQNYYDTNDSLIAIVTTRKTKDSIEKDSINIYYSNYKDSVIEITVNNSYDTITKKIIIRNPNGTLSKIIAKENKDECSTQKEFIYDTKNNLLAEKNIEISDDSNEICNSSYSASYIYNKNNQLVYKENITTINNTTRKTFVYDYNIEEFITNETCYFYFDNILQGYTKSTFDKYKNYLSIQFIDFYYSENNTVKILEDEISHKFKYDAQGNWFEYKEFRNRVQKNYKKRIIKYFK